MTSDAAGKAYRSARARNKAETDLGKAEVSVRMSHDRGGKGRDLDPRPQAGAMEMGCGPGGQLGGDARR